MKGKVVITYARMPQPKQQTVHSATMAPIQDKEILQSLRKKLYEGDVTELLNAMREWLDNALEEDDE